MCAGRYTQRSRGHGEANVQGDQRVRDVRREMDRLIEASIEASALGDQHKARELSAELVRLATLRADLETRSRAGRTVSNLLRP